MKRTLKIIFKRREFLRLHTRDAIEWFGFGWVTRTWLDPTWGGVGTWLWWVNMALASIVVAAMLAVIFTKAKREPTFDEQLKAHLERNDLKLITREQAARMMPNPLSSMPIVKSPFVPKGQFFAVNLDTLADLIRKADPMQFRFTEKIDEPPMPRSWRATPDVSHAQDCALRWRYSSAFGCTCGHNPPSPTPPFVECGEKWQDPDGRCSDDDSGAGMHTCNRNKAHNRRDEQHLCRCGRNT